MICARRETLIKLSHVYSKEYSEAVMKLGGITRKIAKDNWDLVWNLAERARMRSADILIQLKRHKEEHGCRSSHHTKIRYAFMAPAISSRDFGEAI